MSMIFDESGPGENSLRASLRKVTQDSSRLEELYEEIIKSAPEINESETLGEFELFTGPSLKDIPTSAIHISLEKNIAPILILRVDDKLYLRAEEFTDLNDLAFLRDYNGPMLDEKLGDRVLDYFKRELASTKTDLTASVASEGIISINNRRVTALFSQPLNEEEKSFAQQEIKAAFPDKIVSVISRKS